MEPEVVATSPYRIKSPVPVCCGFSSTKMVGERGLAPPRLTDSRSVGSAVPSEPLARNWCSRRESHRQPQPSEGCALIIELQERLAPSRQSMEPLAGAAPARFSYKEDPQAAAKRQKKWWAATVLPRVLRFKRPLHHSLMLAARKMVAIPSAALGGAGL